MPWVVGIDEAGYGPNLGPLSQAAAVLHLPDEDVAGWDTLREVVRRCHEPDDGRLLIDDSKKVYAAGSGLGLLERPLFVGRAGACFGDWLGGLMTAECVAELAAEGWYDGGHSLPLQPCAGETAVEGQLFARLTPTPRFNRLVAESGSKATVLARGLIELMQAAVARLPLAEPILFLCDKQGGRNFYAPMLQHAFPDGWVVADRESALESRYRVMNLDREITVVFRPRADGDSVAVALASMLAKYLREVCMRQFNAFWAKHVPGIEPTAGYPVDAKRYYAAIRPAMSQLGIPSEAVWRNK
jgi:ribonuclease HII